jgi:transcriptional regulator with XRE-family HTH domain
VRRLRLRAGLTQENLAELAGLDHTYVQAVERVRTNFTIEVLVALADALQSRAICFALLYSRRQK